jgi:DNA-binding NarL/FixJ family response regulator
MLKLLVVEDHALVREGLLATLKNLGSETRTFGVADANAAIGVLENEDIDMMILDLMLPGTKGQTFLPLVRRRFPTVPVVILSALDDADTVSRVMKAGASGFVSKSGPAPNCSMPCAPCCRARSTCRPNCRNWSIAAMLAQADGKALVQRFGLTPAQARVLELLAEGRSNRQIGELLGLTEGTVKIHASAIIKAMGVSNRAEAALLANRKRRVN